MDIELSRRAFLQLMGQAGVALPLTSLASCQTFFETIAARPVRRSIGTLADNDPIVESYRAAVASMRALPMSDPRNWTRQADIHLNNCPHGNWFFLPWHRAYLAYFERICRERSGNPDFALPYWNWTQHRSIPAAFWGTASNPLRDTTRARTPTDQVPATVVGPTVMESILSESNFFLFASGEASAPRGGGGFKGRLEATPHDSIHGWIGGNMQTFRSPLDPVFWTHHNMIDCCWNDWNIERSNQNSDDPDWTEYEFTEFCDQNGDAVTVSVLATILMPLLSYRFEPCSPQPQLVLTSATAETVRMRLETGAPRIMRYVTELPRIPGRRISAAERVSLPLNTDLSSLAARASEVSEERVVLRLGDVRLPDQGDFVVNVFLNNPSATPATPIDHPSYVASFAFFTDPRHADHTRPVSYSLDVTGTLTRLRAAGAPLSGASVQLVTAPFAGRASTQSFEVGFVQLGVLAGDRPGRLGR